MQLSTYIFFNGNCSDAVKFYEKHLGAKVVMMMRNADAPPEAKMPGGDNMVMHVRMDIGANMPYQKTFWAHRFGMVTDQFGIPWMVNCEKEA